MGIDPARKPGSLSMRNYHSKLLRYAALNGLAGLCLLTNAAGLGCSASAASQDTASRAGKMTRAQTRQLALDYVALMKTHDLGMLRELCVRNGAPKLQKDSESKWGKGSFPTPSEYCLAGLKRAVEIKEAPVLYVNLALQEQGRREFTFVEDAKLVGNAPATIMRNILAAADAGRGSYDGADGKPRPLTGAQALDIGVTFGSIRPDLVTAPEIVKADRDRVAAACYDPQANRVAVEPKGAPEPIQKVCAAIGRQFGRTFKQAPISAVPPASAPENSVPGAPDAAKNDTAQTR